MITRRRALAMLGAGGISAGFGGCGIVPRAGGADAVLFNSLGECDIRPLDPQKRKALIEAVLLVLRNHYVHLHHKRQVHGADPIPELEALLGSIIKGTDRLSDLAFNRELLRLSRSLRDRHMVYELTYFDCVAYLPFQVEEINESSRRKYIVATVTKSVKAPFAPGVEIVSWGSTPMARAVLDHAERQPGTSGDARRALAVKSLTMRMLRRDGAPYEASVPVEYLTASGTLTQVSFQWRPVYEPRDPCLAPSAAPPSSENAAGSTANPYSFPAPSPESLLRRGDPEIDGRLDLLQRLERRLFAHGSIREARPTRNSARARPFRSGSSKYPTHFEARRYGQGRDAYGYVRISRFDDDCFSAEAFVSEFVRLLKDEVPPEGLLIDIRGNPGGRIFIAECTLQTLKKTRIEPALFQFRNTSMNLRFCENTNAEDPWKFGRWAQSIEQGLKQKELYSALFPRTDLEECGPLRQAYRGPMVLIVDARTYSAADFFAAGFQDHNIGPIVGVHRTTGAGGANVKGYGDVAAAAGYDTALPTLTGLRLPLVRSLRTGTNRGKILEDYGVQVEKTNVHELTRNDVLNLDEDLIKMAASRLVR